MYTRDNDLICNSNTIEKFVHKNYFSHYMAISIVFSISLGIIVGLLVNNNKYFFGLVSAFTAIFILSIIWCIKKLK